MRKSPFNKFISVIFFISVYLILPVYLTRFLSRGNLFILFAYYCVNIIILYLLLRRHYNKKSSIALVGADYEEKINIINNCVSKENKNNISLKEKIRRYSALKGIIEEINQSLSLESTAKNLIDISYSLIANNKGNCVLYLINPQTQKLSLFKTKKEDKKLIIKTKEGDVFDYWVLRHLCPLLIEDIKKDFRFDLESLKSQEVRTLQSLISAPLLAEHEFIGILRLDNQSPLFFVQDDLRLLVTVSELGAVALENDLLFKKTQDLAIHDGLTQLFTKGYFLQRLKDECKRNFRQGEVFSLLMLDIDYFKNYNDKFGHTAGDIVLKSLSSSLTDFLKDFNPIIGRFGGEEFCVCLPRVDKARVETIANGLLKKIENTKVILRRVETNITVSIGVASFPSDATGSDELIFKADRAMYEAKQKGRNNVVCA